jgi:hypothetical protein
VDRTPVVSSNIAAVGFDAAAGTLEVEFKNGAVYDYAGATTADFAGITAAASPGRYLLQNVRGKLAATKVSG